MDELRPCLGDAGVLSAGLSLVVMMCFPGRVWGSPCAGLGCSAFIGEGFPSKLGGAADPESVGSIPVGFYRPTLASGRPAPGLFSQGCQILSLSRREKVASALGQPPSPLLGGQGQELRRSNSFLLGRWHAHSPAFTEATEILPTSFRALITLSRQSLYLYEFVLKNPQTIHCGDLSYCLSLILSYPPSP